MGGATARALSLPKGRFSGSQVSVVLFFGFFELGSPVVFHSTHFTKDTTTGGPASLAARGRKAGRRVGGLGFRGGDEILRSVAAALGLESGGRCGPTYRVERHRPDTEFAAQLGHRRVAVLQRGLGQPHPSPRSLEPGHGSFRGEDAEHEAAGRGRGVDLRALGGEHPQARAAGRQILGLFAGGGEILR